MERGQGGESGRGRRVWKSHVIGQRAWGPDLLSGIDLKVLP